MVLLDSILGYWRWFLAFGFVQVLIYCAWSLFEDWIDGVLRQWLVARLPWLGRVPTAMREWARKFVHNPLAPGLTLLAIIATHEAYKLLPEKRSEPLAVRIVDAPRTQPEAPVQTPDPRATLKTRATELSSAILMFVAERSRHRPDYPHARNDEEWDRQTEAMIRYGDESMAQYTSRFGGKAYAIAQELLRAGIDDRWLEMADHPTNMIGVEKLGTSLAGAAERLP